VPAKDNMFYMGNKNLPNVNWKGEYTKEQVKNLKKANNNILYFAENFFHIINLDRGKEKIQLYKAQKRALRKMRDNRFFCLLASRQIGKSTMMTIYILWQACFNSDQRILISSKQRSNSY
jgi:reverse gyrase